MATTFQSLGLEKLSPVEEMILVDDLSEELEAEGAQSSWLTPLQRDELRRRIADMDAHPHDSIPWGDVKAEIERRYGS